VGGWQGEGAGGLSPHDGGLGGAAWASLVARGRCHSGGLGSGSLATRRESGVLQAAQEEAAGAEAEGGGAAEGGGEAADTGAAVAVSSGGRVAARYVGIRLSYRVRGSRRACLAEGCAAGALWCCRGRRGGRGRGRGGTASASGQRAKVRCCQEALLLVQSRGRTSCCATRAGGRSCFLEPLTPPHTGTATTRVGPRAKSEAPRARGPERQ
jgi:hypothetical protein